MENLIVSTNNTGDSSASQTPTGYPYPYPGWPEPWPTPWPTFPTRLLAMSAGELHGMIYREVLKEATNTDNNDRSIAVKAVDKLLSRGLISEADAAYLEEVDTLGRIIDNFDARKPQTARDAAQSIRALYEKMLDEGCTVTALILVGIANNSAQNAVETYSTTGTVQRGFFGSDWDGAKGGAAAGGAVGAGVGGVPGAGVGAGVGAIVGAGAQSFAWCIDNDCF